MTSVRARVHHCLFFERRVLYIEHVDRRFISFKRYFDFFNRDILREEGMFGHQIKPRRGSRESDSGRDEMAITEEQHSFR